VRDDNHALKELLEGSGLVPGERYSLAWGIAATSWAVPFRATPRHGARRIADRKRATPAKGGQPRGEPSAGHLDRVWPDTDPVGNRLAAATDWRRSAGRDVVSALGWAGGAARQAWVALMSLLVARITVNNRLPSLGGILLRQRRGQSDSTSRTGSSRHCLELEDPPAALRLLRCRSLRRRADPACSPLRARRAAGRPRCAGTRRPATAV
jgi:hypothetical protein